MKRFLLRGFAMFLLFPFILSCGCSDNNTSDISSSMDSSSDTEYIVGEALSESEKIFEDVVYSDSGIYLMNNEDTPGLTFDEPMGLYGEKSIAVIGDSISYGQNALQMYNYSWVSLFKNSVNKKLGTNNMGYVSMMDYSGYGGFENHEFHTITAESGTWGKTRPEPATPGFCSYGSSSEVGSTLLIKFNRKQDSVDRHINGFYVYYMEASHHGEFDISVNGEILKTIDSSNGNDSAARSEYIPLPTACGDEVEIRIIKKDSRTVKISGIAYAESSDGIMIHNYSHSGQTAKEADNELLRKLCNANYVIFALGYNDSGNVDNLSEFIVKLNVVAEACKASGATLIVADFLWPSYGPARGPLFRQELIKCAKSAGGYYIDLTILYSVSKDVLSDAAHPSQLGHEMIARKLCSFFNIEFESIIK